MKDRNFVIKTLKDILVNCEVECEYLHRQNYYHASLVLKKIISLLTQFIDNCSSYISPEVIEELVSIFEEISITQEANNVVLLSDTLELKLVPLIAELQKLFLSEAEPVEDFFDENVNMLETSLKTKLIKNRKESSICSYNVEFTNIGALTLCGMKNDSMIYFHSNGDPYKEARSFADEYSEDEYMEYIVFGIGLGYHVKALLEYDQRYKVIVMEYNLDVITLACIYNDFATYLQSGRLEIRYIYSYSDITKYFISNKAKFIVHYPSLIMMDDNEFKDAINEYFVNLSSIHAHTKELDVNFYFNQKLEDKSIDFIKNIFNEKTVVYIGGGPSTQKRLQDIVGLRKKEDSILICAGTVYRKLIQLGVIPDYVIITDPSPTLITQIDGVDGSVTTMLYLSTASKDAVAKFKGNRYVLYQNSYTEAEEIANEYGYTLFETGGSVSTLAIDMALRFKCKKLVCVGLDLAFSDNKRHAFGIGGNVNTEDKFISVEAVEGGKINTSNNFNMYRKWIEKRILGEKEVEMVNLSRGAKIHGMRDE